MELVRHHVEEEEGEMFPEVRDALSAGQLETSATDSRQPSVALRPIPHPRSPDTPPGNVVAGAVASVMDQARDFGRGSDRNHARQDRRCTRRGRGCRAGRAPFGQPVDATPPTRHRTRCSRGRTTRSAAGDAQCDEVGCRRAVGLGREPRAARRPGRQSRPKKSARKRGPKLGQEGQARKATGTARPKKTAARKSATGSAKKSAGRKATGIGEDRQAARRHGIAAEEDGGRKASRHRPRSRAARRPAQPRSRRAS